MQDLKDKKILLGICGGIAAYKSALLVRELVRLGAVVRVVMTASACRFIAPLTFQALSGNEVRTDLFDETAERAMGHIELARWADCLVIAPASAACLARLAQGLADDLLSTLYLAANVPLIVCPAMNQAMWRHPATQQNCEVLRQRGALMVGPDEGSQACGDYGPGRLSEVEDIISAILLQPLSQRLVGKSVLITAGATRESVDPVRFLSNRSSGKMGYALARAARIAGAKVTLISGPTALTVPSGVAFCPVVSAREMHAEVMARLELGDIFIACAAVADYAPEAVSSKKIKRKDNPSLVLKLVAGPDILRDVSLSKKASLVVGFAAETNDVTDNARQKLRDRQLDIIIANQVGDGQGFESDSNAVTILCKDDRQIELPLSSKISLAGQIIAILAATVQNDSFSMNGI